MNRASKSPNSGQTNWARRYSKFYALPHRAGRDIARVEQWVDIVSILPDQYSRPLPARLSLNRVLGEARPVHDSFLEPFRRTRYEVLSWPDGTRAAIRPARVTKLVGLAAYARARLKYERYVADPEQFTGGTA